MSSDTLATVSLKVVSRKRRRWIKAGWAYGEKSTVSSDVSLPEKELQTTGSSLLQNVRARRFTIYDLRVPTTTLNSS